MTFLIAAVSLAAAAVSYAAKVWLTNDLSVSGLAIIPTTVVAAGLVWYFERRNELRQRILSSRRSPDGESEVAASDF